MPMIVNCMAIAGKLLRSVSVVLLVRIMPISAVGMVAVMIRGVSFPFSVLKSLFHSA